MMPLFPPSPEVLDCVLRFRESGNDIFNKSSTMSAMSQTNDIEIRRALHGKKLSAYRTAPDTIVVDELGLAHAKARIDVAVINGCVHGYEIKSSVDTLNRLPAQLELYSQCLKKLTLVCAPRHVEKVVRIAPQWCGILEAEKGARGAVKFTTVRRTGLNEQIDPVQLAHLLWRPEAVDLLSRFETRKKILNRPRKELYEALAEVMTIPQLTVAIREFMQLRQAWRGLPARA
jgi:hypothetical protein